jgi:hypothetical protein
LKSRHAHCDRSLDRLFRVPNDDNFGASMIFRSGFLRAAIATSGAALLFSFAACGGKVIEEGGGGDDSSSNHDAGKPDGSTACNGDLNIPACPLCKGEVTAPAAQCIDGQWECPTTRCEGPPNNCDQTTADCTCGSASCIDNQWVCPADCGGYCPASVDGLNGEPCVTDGLICGDECGDPCEQCNYVVCTGGAWNEVESVPTACDGGAGG